MPLPTARRLGRILGGLTAAIYGLTLIYSVIPPTIGRSVPLRLTDLATASPDNAALADAVARALDAWFFDVQLVRRQLKKP